MQVAGPGSFELVKGCLRARGGIDLACLGAGELRLCRIVDDEEVLDQILVAARVTEDGTPVVDLSLHGGPRIVQRVLLLLQRRGASIVTADALLNRASPARTLIEAEALAALPRAATRAVALWLARVPVLLENEVVELEQALQAGRCDAVLARLRKLLASFKESRYLLEGARIVLTGAPNSGKSTLANALAGAEHSIVSDVPGTTRDWVEHRTAVDGIPLTLVDTAGIRETLDAIEQEAIHRSTRQAQHADLTLSVVDASAAPSPSDRQRNLYVMGENSSTLSMSMLVWNKSDLPRHPGHGPLTPSSTADGISISARTGDGLAALRAAIKSRLGMEGWADRPVRLFTGRQAAQVSQAMSAMADEAADSQKTLRCIRALTRLSGI
ncbi:MAG: hypothetical protein AMXMBFR13_27190 [Phycisphaerae bacterium]